jgi:membrane protease YdiL (CAAX protease family)
MVDELLDLRTCRVCGATLADDSRQAGNICGACATHANVQQDSVMGDSAVFAGVEQPSGDFSAGRTLPPDPDQPAWGPLTAVGVWAASVAAIIIVPIIAVVVWYIISKARGAEVPGFQAKDELIEWLKSPRLLLVQVASTFVAHAITLAICWAVVTKLGTRGFWASLGWHWGGRSPVFWLLFSAGVIVALVCFSQVAIRFLPESQDTAFAELLRSSRQVRVAVAVLATLSAPIVEEVIYRGVLFSALRNRTGVAVAVGLVTMLFAGVHFLQYSGAWVTISGLIFLSLILTVVRARTGSILPSVTIHFVNNAFFSLLIVANKG